MKLTIIILFLAVVIVASATSVRKPKPCGHKDGCKSNEGNNSGSVKPSCGKKGGCEGNKSNERDKPGKPSCGKKGGCKGDGSSSEESNSTPPPTKPPVKPTKNPPCGKKGGCGNKPGDKSSDESNSGPSKPTKRPPTKPPCSRKSGCGNRPDTKSSEDSNSGPVLPSPKPTKRPRPTKHVNSDDSSESSESNSDDNSSQCRQSSEEIISPLDDQKTYDTVKIVKSYNYPCESHEVITKDGFRIQIQRIPSNEKNKRKHRRPVLLIADFWGSSLFWVISGKEYSLAIYLADIGFDVWLANDRGNQYGQQHVNFDIKHPSYWDYSFDKIGKYDIPAIIDYVLEYHKCEKISIIAWGYGATACFSMVSDRPEYAKRISSLQALAPTVYMQHTQSPLLIGFYKQDQQSIFSKVGRYQIIQNKNLLQKAGRAVCRRNSPNKEYCNHLQPLFGGSVILGINNPYYPAILNSPRSQASVKYLLHILQQVKDGCFRKFDYGAATNQLLYASDEPPLYDLSASVMPVAVYYSNDDALAVPKDVVKLWDKLSNQIGLYCVDKPNYSHVHFALSPYARQEYYDKIQDVLEKYIDD